MRATSIDSSAGVGEVGVARAEVDRGDAERGEAGDVGPAVLGPRRPAPAAATKSRAAGAAKPGQRAGRGVDERHGVRARGPPARGPAPRASLRSGANRKLIVTVQASGTTLPATPAADPHRGQALAVDAAVDVDRARLVGRRASKAAARQHESRCPRARSGRCGRACPARMTSTRSVPWQPASMTPSVGSSRTARSPASQSAVVLGEPPQAVARRLDLLVVVEDEREVAGRLRHRRGQVQQHGDARLHVGRAAAVHALAVARGTARCRRSARCRGGRRAPPAAGGRGR